jgi:hypothetical protein
MAILVSLSSLVLGSTLPAFAQSGGTSGNVNGTVLSNTGAPVSGATVVIASPSGSFTQHTDSHGYFSFLGVPADTYTISIQQTGFQTLSQGGITVTGASTQSLGSVRLSIVPRVIGSTSARSASSAFQPNQTIPQYTISGSVLNAAAGKSANANETQILLAVPGFQIDSQGNLILQGATTDQIRYQFDGVDFTDPGFSHSANGQFFNAIGSVQVVPGAGDPSQGNGGAGVVNLLVKRGTYPPSGLIDGEINLRPQGNQENIQYGTATANGRFSDYVSYFGINQAYQVGPYGASPFDVGAVLEPSRQLETDFVNNFVTRFGPGNNQSLQVLYLAHAFKQYGNYAGLPLYYDDGDAPTLGNLSYYSGLSTSQVASILAFDPGQTYAGEPAPPVWSTGSTSLLKFEYDNQLNASTSLAVRFYHSDIYDFQNAAASTTAIGALVPTYSQTSGGSRTGANFDLNAQIGQKNTVTLSGQYTFNRPNFGAVDPIQGFEGIIFNAQDFLVPANPNQPVSAANPCPIPGGCYLQQFFYQSGGTPKAPSLTLNSQFPNAQYGLGLRDQLQVTKQLRLDLGLRYDIFNQFLTPGYVESQDENTQPVPGNPDAYYLPNYGFVNHPHFLQPRLGLSYQITKQDSISLSNGKSINLGGNGLYASPEAYTNQFLSAFQGIPINPNWLNGTFFGNPSPVVNANGTSLCNVDVPYPIGAGPTTAPSYNGTTAGPNPTLQMGRGCADYADLLRSELDLYFPEIINLQPAVLYNSDVTYAHLFKGGIAIKIDGFNRQAYHVQETTAPVIFDPTTGTTSVGSLTSTTNGVNYTTGVSLNVTLPDRPYGLTGFASATYTNELTNTPSFGDNPYGQDFEPFVPGAFNAVNNGQGQLYRAGFVSPLTVHVGLSYKTRSGWRFNPVLNFSDGFPYNIGNTTPYEVQGNYINVPNTNITDQYSPAGAPNFVDPANPGSVLAPVISAARGNKEGYAGSQLSPSQTTMDMTIEYSPPSHPRNTIGLQILDVFNNGYYTHPAVNDNFYPVTTGVAGPLTGQNPVAVAYPGLSPLVSPGTYPYAPYVIDPFVGGGTQFENLPISFRLYYQLKI